MDDASKHTQALPRHSILDPTGNITALVEDAVAVGEQPAVAVQIMAAHPEVEQVGFVRVCEEGMGVQAELRMAGGEFCGNASMCAAALWAWRTGHADGREQVNLRVSGAEEPVAVVLEPRGDGFDAAVAMPHAREVMRARLAFGGHAAEVPVVLFEGIAHAVIEEGSPFFYLQVDRAIAEEAVRAWCEGLAADGLGLMFCSGTAPELALTPLVYVPGSGTVFWESSCASGSAAVGIWHAHAAGAPVDLTLHEPAGTLRVTSDTSTGDTWLFGTVR